MTVFDRRHLPWLVALLAVAAVPTTLSALRPGRWDDCADPEGLREIGARLPGRQDAEFQRFYWSHVFQRSEGELELPGRGRRLRTRIVRSDEASYLYDAPTRMLQVPMDPEGTEVRWVDAGGARIPVHVTHAHFGELIRVVTSLFVYDGRPVERLLPVQLESALRQLVRGRRPMTLLQAEGVAPRGQRARIEGAMLDWLATAWEAYRGICAAPAAS